MISDFIANQLERGLAVQAPSSYFGPGPSTAMAAPAQTAIEAAKKPGMFSIRPQTKMLWNANMSVAKFNGRMAMGAYGIANDMSKVLLKASLPQIGAAAGITAAAGYALLNHKDTNWGTLANNTVGAFHRSIKQASKPVYGYSALGQSTQGLVFGLNSRRTA